MTLQTDPIGGEDDLNLYAYVGGDPVNKSDPTGTKCTGAGEKSECKIDYIDGKKISDVKLTKDQAATVKRVESAMTSAYKDAQSRSKETFTIKGDAKLGIKDTKVTGAQIVKTMQSSRSAIESENRVDRASGRSVMAEYNSTYKVSVGLLPSGQNHFRTAPTIVYRPPGYTDSKSGMKDTFVHEALHPNAKQWDQVPSHVSAFQPVVDEILE